jgi:hypothetical protein
MPARRPRPRSRRAGDGAKLFAAAALSLVALGAAGVGVYVWATAARPPARDQRTFCPLDGPAAITVMLIDSSDPLPPATREEVTKRLSDIADDLPDYAALDVRLLDPSQRTGRQVFSMCNPGDGRGLSEFTGNPTLAKRRWKERFREPLDLALNNSLQPQRSDTSPLLATLQGIALDRFTGKAVADIPKNLVIVSDMLEYEKEYSQYPPRDLSYQRFKATPLYLKLRTDLGGAKVQIFYVQRFTRPPIDSAAHIRFWIDWVQDNRGQFKGATKLQGAGQS